MIGEHHPTVYVCPFCGECIDPSIYPWLERIAATQFWATVCRHCKEGITVIRHTSPWYEVMATEAEEVTQ